MRVLIDECLDWRLGRELPGHLVESVPRRGWSGIKNGRLLALAGPHFDVFLAVDRNLSFQQNQAALTLAVIVLSAGSVKRKDLLPLMPKVLAALPTLAKGQVLVIAP